MKKNISLNIVIILLMISMVGCSLNINGSQSDNVSQNGIIDIGSVMHSGDNSSSQNITGEDEDLELITWSPDEYIASRQTIVYDGSLSDSDAIQNANDLYAYLKNIYTNSCITGQMESTWMGSPDYEMDYIQANTGKLPAIRGLDFMNNDFAGVTSRSIEWWNNGGIVTICWHTGADFASGYQECLDDNLDWDKALTPGTKEYTNLINAMDRAVPYLQQLQDQGIPVLWRPFHELDGGWFWWSKGGADNFVKLWQLMYTRYTDYWGLHNLIWVFGYSHQGWFMENWYPGDGFVDLLGADSYTAGANDSLYEKCQKIAPDGMPLVFHECGSIPTAEEMSQSKWLYFMVWHTDYITDSQYNTPESISEIYNDDYFITLDGVSIK